MLTLKLHQPQQFSIKPVDVYYFIISIVQQANSMRNHTTENSSDFCYTCVSFLQEQATNRLVLILWFSCPSAKNYPGKAVALKIATTALTLLTSFLYLQYSKSTYVKCASFVSYIYLNRRHFCQDVPWTI